MGLFDIQGFIAHASWVNCVAFSPVDPTALATSSSDHTICIWILSEDRKSVALRHKLTGHTWPVSSFAWSNDGLFLVSGSYDNTIRKWNVSTGKCEATIRTHKWVYALAFSPDDKRIVTSDDNSLEDCSVCVRDVSSGRRILCPSKGHTDTIQTVAYSPDGRRILSGSLDKTIIVWDSATGEILFGPFAAHSSTVRSISFHPSGEAFVTSSNDKTITIWDANTFESITKSLHLHADRVTSVQYSRDGRFILSASDDGTLRVWDVKRGRVASNSVENGCSVRSAAFSPDGRWVASGGKDGVVRIWEFCEMDTP